MTADTALAGEDIVPVVDIAGVSVARAGEPDSDPEQIRERFRRPPSLRAGVAGRLLRSLKVLGCETAH